MYDIEQLTQDLIEQVLESLDDSPVKIGQAILHDELYDLCYRQVLDDLAAEEENRREEIKYDEYNNTEE